ncbi:Gfo/Idh/MocA family protein [Homoserinimonas sp. OAct 916]|uniref:Gfo/Idh/MocA family protein n=1 Tax=Homoserinimonas sp. OAct 916 TaxID=2211450 RepID=UPI001300BD1D|nr:Gfo/Idh/MocA family oxidoreductase [Homoserinimonas sp. OAct 916]
MDNPLKWGILSTAFISETMLSAMFASPTASPVAIASRSSDRAEATAEKWGLSCAFGTYDELLACPRVEAVYIPLPNKMHHIWTMRALRAGKHVLCEKPYSSKPHEVVEAFTAARSHGLVLSEGFMFRYDPVTCAVVRAVAEGSIGRLRIINASYSWPTPLANDLRLDASMGGGALLDTGVYCISSGRLFAGEPVRVSANQVMGPTGVDIMTAGYLAFESDVILNFDCALHLPQRGRLELVGDQGSLIVDDPWLCRNSRITLHDRSGAREIEVELVNAFQLELEEFAAAVRGEDNCLLGECDALGQAATVAALGVSAREGKVVKL